MLRNNEIHCQICKNEGHEALLCPCTECIYCKSGNHTSYYCESDKNKIECNLCNQEGHTINTCKFNTTNLTHCQYCQILGHTATQCPDIPSCLYCRKKIHSTAQEASNCKETIISIFNFFKEFNNSKDNYESLRKCLKISTVELHNNKIKESSNDFKIQKNEINAANIEIYDENKQEINIIKESKIINNDEEINLIVEPFIKINEIPNEPKINNTIIKNHENTNEINFIDFCKNNHEIEQIKETNLIDFTEYETNDKINFNDSDIKNYEDCDEINLIDFRESNEKTDEDNDEMNVVDFNESDINNQQNENSNENNKDDNNSLETVTFYDDLKVILDITFTLAESFESEDHQIETKLQQKSLENSLEANIALIHSEESLLNDTKNLKNLLNDRKVVFENENQSKDMFDNQELQKHLENKNHLKIFDNQEHQEQLENKSQLTELLDNQDHNAIINLNTNPNKEHQLQLVFNYPIKVTYNKNVRKLRWISNYQEYFKEFLKNTKLKLKSKDYKEYFKEFIKNTKLKSKDYYNKFNTKKNFKKGDKTWSIKKPNKNKVERNQHKNSQCYWNKIISTSKDNNR